MSRLAILSKIADDSIGYKMLTLFLFMYWNSFGCGTELKGVERTEENMMNFQSHKNIGEYG